MLERTYTIPLRKEWLKSPKFKRTKKAVIALRQFLSRHMKAEEENVRLGKYLNEFVWSHGIRAPPPRVKVNVVKDDKGIVKAELVGAPKEEKKAEKVEKKTEVVAKEEPKVEVHAKQSLSEPLGTSSLGEKKVEAKTQEVKATVKEDKKETPVEASAEKPKARRDRSKKAEQTKLDAT